MRPTILMLSLLILTSSEVAATDGEPTGDRRYLGNKSHVTMELDFAHASNEDITIFGMQPIISARFAVSPRFGIDAALPFTYVSISDGVESESDFRFGNAYVGLDYRLFARPDQNLSIGLGIGLPTAQLDDDNLTEALKAALNYSAAFASRGFHRAWLYFPENLTFVPHVSFIGYSGQLYFQAFGALPIFVETSEQNDQLDAAIDLQGRAGYDFGPVVPYLGLSFVWFVTEHPFGDGDDAQFGIDIGALVELSRSVLLELAVHLNIDSPLETFGDAGFTGFYVDVTFEL